MIVFGPIDSAEEIDRWISFLDLVFVENNMPKVSSWDTLYQLVYRLADCKVSTYLINAENEQMEYSRYFENRMSSGDSKWKWYKNAEMMYSIGFEFECPMRETWFRLLMD